MTIGDAVQEQAFRIRVDPRLGGDTPANLREFADIGALSASLMAAADAMGKGVNDLRLVKKQLTLITELDQDDEVTEKAAALDATIDAWIENILQKELKTFQHVYQHEGRLLMKIKDLLGRMHGSDIPLTNGFKEVTGDYLDVWAGHNSQLTRIKQQDVANFNAVARAAGVAEVHIP